MFRRLSLVLQPFGSLSDKVSSTTIAALVEKIILLHPIEHAWLRALSKALISALKVDEQLIKTKVASTKRLASSRTTEARAALPSLKAASQFTFHHPIFRGSQDSDIITFVYEWLTLSDPINSATILSISYDISQTDHFPSNTLSFRNFHKQQMKTKANTGTVFLSQIPIHTDGGGSKQKASNLWTFVSYHQSICTPH